MKKLILFIILALAVGCFAFNSETHIFNSDGFGTPAQKPLDDMPKSFVETKIPHRIEWVDKTDKFQSLGAYKIRAVTSDGVVWMRDKYGTLFKHTGYRCYPCNFGGVNKVWKSGDNYYLLTVDVIDEEIKFYRSTDGGFNWTEKIYDTNHAAAGMRYSFVDCGNGRLLYINYSGHDRHKCIWGSTDNGANFSKILEIAANGGSGNEPIRHFHGGVYDEDNDKLFIFTGDVDPTDGEKYENTILYCDDVNDFLSGEQSWSTNWKEKWGLLDQNDSYDGSSVTNPQNRVGLDPDYVLNDDLNSNNRPTTQQYRVVDMYIEQDDDGDYYGYFGADSSGEPGGSTYTKYNLTKFYTSKIKDAEVLTDELKGITWYNATSKDGDIIFTVYPAVTNSGSWYGSGDGYTRIYALADDREIVYPIAKWDAGINTDLGSHLIELFNYSKIFDVQFAAVDSSLTVPDSNTEHYYTKVDDDYDFNFLAGNVQKEGYAEVLNLGTHGGVRSFNFNATNLLKNPLFYDNSWADDSHWDILQSTLSQVTDPCEIGRKYSMKITPNASATDACARYKIDDDERMNVLAGRTITFSAMIYLPSAITSSQNPAVKVGATIDGGYNNQQTDIPEAMFDDDWHLISITYAIPGGEVTSLELRVYAHTDSDIGTPEPVYVSSPRVVLGQQPGAEGILPENFYLD